MAPFKCEIPSFSLFSKLLLSFSFLQALVVMALEIAISVIFIRNVDIGSNEIQEGSGKSITVYLFIFIFSQLYQFGMILNAIWEKNTIQVFAHVLFCACMVGFSIFQYFQIQDALSYLDQQDVFGVIKPLLITSIIVLAVCTMLFCYFDFKLFWEFGWKIYKKIGADPRKRVMYRSYQILIMLLKFAEYFFLAFAIQFLVLVLKVTDPEFGLTIFAIFISFFIIGVVVYGLRTETRWIIIIWMIFLLLVVAYFAFKIARIYDPAQAHKYVGSGKFLTLFASLGLVVMVITFVFSVIVYRNFGKGLKDHLLGDVEPMQPRTKSETSTRTLTLA